MGTTTALDLPYPEPADRARAGSVAIRALAEALEQRFAPAYFLGALHNGAAGSSGTGAVPIIGTKEATSHFAYDAGTGEVTYTGPTRTFLIHGQVSVHGTHEQSVHVAAQVNGTDVAISEVIDHGGDSADLTANGYYSGHVSAVTRLASGNKVRLWVAAVDGAHYYPALHVVALGAAE